MSQTSDSMAPRAWLQLEDAQLVRQCAVDTYLASGHGGHNRNKVTSAVRLLHDPSGLMVTATERRSQHENKVRAIQRLRTEIALQQRNHLPADEEAPAFYREALQRDPTLRVNRKNPDYCLIVQHVLDVIFAEQGRVSDAAKRLALSTGHLNRFLKNDPRVWRQVNELRKAFGLAALRG